MTAERWIGCSDCGTLQGIPPLVDSSVAMCRSCGRLFDRAARPALGVSFAWSAAMLLLLIPGNLFPLMSTSIAGRTHAARLAAAPAAVWADGYPILAILLGTFLVVLPFVWAGLLTLVLGVLRTRHRPRWLGWAFRQAEWLRFWAMPEVLLTGGAVVYVRLAKQLTAHLEVGGWCMIAAAALGLAVPRVMAPQSVWRAIGPEDARAPADGATLSCLSCNLVRPRSSAGSPCPRCHRKLVVRGRSSLVRTIALVVTAYLLFFPAYYYPLSYSVRPDQTKEHTVFVGVRELFDAGLWYLGLIIIVASFLIPLLKLVGLTWLVASVLRRSEKHLALKTKVHRLIHGIGRWSITDPLVVALSIAMMSFGTVVQVHAARGALPFALVVVTTMFASRSFDPRLLWDAKRGAA